MNKIAIGTVIGILGLIGSAYTWDVLARDKQHNEISNQVVTGDVELELDQIELKLKLYRTIEERRELTPDELDDRNYLLQLREILREKRETRVS